VRLAIGIVVGAIVALIVYIVGTEVAQFKREDLVIGLVALLVWFGVAYAIAVSPSRRLR
jgi:hypothetical protein